MLVIPMFVIVSVAFDHEDRVCSVIEYPAQRPGALVIPMFVIVSVAFDHEDRVCSVIECPAQRPGTLVIPMFVNYRSHLITKIESVL